MLNSIKNLIYVLMLLSSVCVLAQQKTDAASEGLQGKVRSLATISVSAEGKASWKRDAIKFNPQGFMTERVIYDDRGNPAGTTTYTYDAAGHLTQTRMVDPKGNRLEDQSITYDKNGRQSSVRASGDGENETSTDRFTYAADGQLQRVTHSDAKKTIGSTQYKRTATTEERSFLDAAGKPAMATTGPCLGAQRIVITKDAQGRVTEQSAYDEKGKLKNKRSYTYDAKGNVASMTTESTTSMTRYDYLYDFDKKGNWIKQTVKQTVLKSPKELMNHASSGGGTHSLERKIEYY